MHSRRERKIEDYITCLLGLYVKLDGPYSVEEQLDNAHRGLRPEFRRVMKRKDIADFEELAQLGKDWEVEWVTIRDYKPPPAPETSFLPEFAYKGEENRNTRASLAVMDANLREENISSEKEHTLSRTARCDAMSHSLPRQKSPRQK